MTISEQTVGTQSTQTMSPSPKDSGLPAVAEKPDTENTPQEIDSTRAEEIDKAFNTVENSLKEVDDILLPLASGAPLGGWVPMLPELQKINKKLDPAKKVLISIIEVFDTLIDAAEALINLIEAFIGFLLDQASAILLILKAAVQMLKQVIKQLKEALQLSLLESGMYYGQFVFTWNDVYRRSDKYNVVANTGPLVYNTLTASVTEWMNRPQAQNTLCGLMFIPFSIPHEAARAVSGALKLSELLEYHLDKLRKELAKNSKKTVVKEDALVAATGQILPRIAENMRRMLTPGTTYSERRLVSESIRTDVEDNLSKAIDSVTTDLLDKLDATVALQDQTAEERLLKAEADPEFNDMVPGSMIFAGSKLEKGKAVLYSNYRNKSYRYISSIFKVSEGEVSEVFRDPSFLIATLAGDPEVKKYVSQISDIIRSYFKIKESYRLAPERGMWDTQFCSTLPGLIAARISSGNIPDKVIPYIVLHSLLTYPKIPSGISELTKAYSKQLQKVDLEYGRRSVIGYRRLYPDNLMMNSAKEGDIYYITFAPQDTLYFGDDFLTSSTPPKGVQTGRWLAGTPEAIGGTTVGIIKVRKDIDTYPMWYSASTPEAANSRSSDRLLSDLLPPAVTNSIDNIYTILDNAEEGIDNALKSISKTKEKVQDIKAEIMRYITIIRGISDSVKEFIDNLDLLKLPEMYIVTWKGNATDIPAIMMNALMERNILQSTYGGAMVFAEATALSAMLEMYKAGRDAIDRSEQIASDTAAYIDTLDSGEDWADVASKATALSEKGDAIKTAFDNVETAIDVLTHAGDSKILAVSSAEESSLDTTLEQLKKQISGYMYSRKTRITVPGSGPAVTIPGNVKHDGDLDE